MFPPALPALTPPLCSTRTESVPAAFPPVPPVPPPPPAPPAFPPTRFTQAAVFPPVPLDSTPPPSIQSQRVWLAAVPVRLAVGPVFARVVPMANI